MRWYEFSIEISDFNPNRSEDIKLAVEDVWDFDCDNWGNNPNLLFNAAQSSLSGSEREKSNDLANAVWKANGGFCKVNVVATNLEDAPFGRYAFGEEDYEKLKDEQNAN